MIIMVRGEHQLDIRRSRSGRTTPAALLVGDPRMPALGTLDELSELRRLGLKYSSVGVTADRTEIQQHLERIVINRHRSTLTKLVKRQMHLIAKNPDELNDLPMPRATGGLVAGCIDSYGRAQTAHAGCELRRCRARR